MAINLNPYNYSSTLFGNQSNSSSSGMSSLYSLMLNNKVPTIRTTSTQLDWRTSVKEAAKQENGTNKQLTEDGKQFLSEAKRSAASLQSTLSSLIGKNSKNGTSAGSKKAVSANNDVLAVKNVDSKKASNMNSISVDISQVATTQKNTGSSMDSSANAVKSGATAGSNMFKIELGGKTRYMDFVVSSKDTVRDAQQKMADEINSQNFGVKASVVYDEKTKTSSLNIESIATGTDNEDEPKFKISDVTGNAVSVFGANEISQKAQNAVYSVNGGREKTSKTNDVDIGNGVTATLKKASESSVNVSIERDTLPLINDTRKMVNDFNSLMTAADDNSDDIRSATLFQSLYGIANSSASSLSKIGISQDSNGYLKIDEAKMKTAADSGALEKFFTENSSSSYGFANRLSKLAQDVDKNTDRYVSKASQQGYGSLFGMNTNSSYLFDYLL